MIWQDRVLVIGHIENIIHWLHTVKYETQKRCQLLWKVLLADPTPNESETAQNLSMVPKGIHTSLTDQWHTRWGMRKQRTQSAKQCQYKDKNIHSQGKFDILIDDHLGEISGQGVKDLWNVFHCTYVTNRLSYHTFMWSLSYVHFFSLKRTDTGYDLSNSAEKWSL